MSCSSITTGIAVPAAVIEEMAEEQKDSKGSEVHAKRREYIDNQGHEFRQDLQDYYNQKEHTI